MVLLVLKAYVGLIYFDFLVMSESFARLYRKVHSQPLFNRRFQRDVSSICLAVDIACICYPKRVLCLQRSAATACLLRSYGISAQMVIGACPMPFRSHAWVEVAGQIVNDKPYTTEMYAVLDRC
jgi:Transglutaminase-like superfamily